MPYVEYESNNSGGDWWLTDDNWRALESAGWEVKWFKDDPYYEGEDRFLGALASGAISRDTTLSEAIRKWEQLTGENSSSLGCSCCGTPHNFTLYSDDGKWLESYSPSFPEYGDPYDD